MLEIASLLFLLGSVLYTMTKATSFDNVSRFFSLLEVPVCCDLFFFLDNLQFALHYICFQFTNRSVNWYYFTHIFSQLLRALGFGPVF